MKKRSITFTTILLVLGCLALSPTVQTAPPPPPPPPPPTPDGGLPNGNTVEGTGALFSLKTGTDNTAMGFNALHSNTTGNWNTAYGSQALFSNTTGGTDANANGSTAIGFQALYSNTTGEGNVATGYQALLSNTTGVINTATGRFALFSNTTGNGNTADGGSALRNNTTGNSNTAVGRLAMFNNTSGNGNIALGRFAGGNLDTGNDNIDIGNFDTTSGSSTDVAGESNTIRIGVPGTQTATFIAGIYGATTSDAGSSIPVYVDMNGNLGTAASSERFKEEIKPMDQTSEAILGLKPVTFHYKNDSKGKPQFGLIAEEVAKVNPDLVAHDKNGEIYTVRYDAVNAMLLNEFLKEHRAVQELKKEVGALVATVKEQATQLQKVSAQVEASKPAPQVVLNNR